MIEVDENKLYRTYREERIYFNEYVWMKFREPGNIYKWRSEEAITAEVGDWIIADDEYVLKIIGKRTYKTVTFYKFCNVQVNYSYYVKKNGEITKSFSKFLGGYTALKNTRGQNGKYISGKYQDREIKKITFANLLLAGMHPYQAYKVTHNSTGRYLLSIEQLNYKILELLKDKIVMEIINKGRKMSNFQNLEQKIQEAFPDEYIIAELKKLIDSSRKGSDAHRENLKFVMALCNTLPTRIYGKKVASVNSPNLEIENSEYEVEKPPELAQSI